MRLFIDKVLTRPPFPNPTFSHSNALTQKPTVQTRNLARLQLVRGII